MTENACTVLIVLESEFYSRYPGTDSNVAETLGTLVVRRTLVRYSAKRPW